MFLFNPLLRAQSILIDSKNIILLALMFIGAFFSTSAQSAIDIVTRCDNCSNPASLARNLAGSQSRFGVTVFIGDFERDRAFNYFVIDNNPLTPEGKATDPLAALDRIVGPTQIINEDAMESATRVCSTTRVIQIAIPQREQEHFEGFVRFENFLSSNGINTSFNNFRPSVTEKMSSDVSAISFGSSPLDGCPNVATTINVQVDGTQPFTSAF